MSMWRIWGIIVWTWAECRSIFLCLNIIVYNRIINYILSSIVLGKIIFLLLILSLVLLLKPLLFFYFSLVQRKIFQSLFGKPDCFLVNLLRELEIAIDDEAVDEFFCFGKRVGILSQKYSKLIRKMAKLAFVFDNIKNILNHLFLIPKLRSDKIVLSI